MKTEDDNEVYHAQIPFTTVMATKTKIVLWRLVIFLSMTLQEFGALKDELFAAIESLNPYPEQLSALTLENKGTNSICR